MIDWEKKIQIDTAWIDRQLIHHFSENDKKIFVRGFTPKTSGTKFSCESLVEELGFLLTQYVHSEDAKKTLSKSLITKYGETTGSNRLNEALLKEAQSFFGKKDPKTDGKYGELLLFAITESILKCKMVAHKIEGLSNGKDQVKGGDGIFMGNYEVEKGDFQPAILIGESKIMQNFSSCLDDAFLSLDRFHNAETQTEFNSMEFIVAKKTMFMDTDDIDYNEIYERLTPGTDEYRKQVLVHPILIMYNTTSIGRFETEAKNNNELEIKIRDYMVKNKEKLLKGIKQKISKYPSIQKVYVDFFCFPFNDIDSFRNGLYFNIHKVPFPSK